MFPSHKMLTVIVFACVAVYPGNGELFTSSAHLQNALWAEGAMASTIREYVRDQIQRLNGLSKLADNLEEHSSSLETPEGHIANPVNAYLFVKRFTIDWDRDFAALIEGKTIENLEERLTSYKDYLPNYEDLNGAVAALLRLQDTYNLDTDSIAHGNIYGLRSSELSAADCFELGRIAYQTEDFYHTHLWMEEALKLIEMEVNKTLGRPEILDYLAFSLFKEGDIKRALTLTEELLFLMPDHQRAQSNKVYYKKMLADQDEGKARGDDGVVKKEEKKEDIPEGLKLVDSYKVSDEFKTYEKLCRGETTHEYEDQHKLKCRYYNNNFDPLLILLPAKQEEVYLDPYLVFYHDVVTDYEMNVIKQLATPKLGRATVHNSVTGKLETANYRISKSAWLKSEDHPVISRVNNRIQAITSLDMNTAEELQVANYGLGGHYEPHFDFARRRVPSPLEMRLGNRIATFLIYKEETNAFKSLGTGNRIATWLTYMTDVEAGGATVFPYIGVKIFPEKGGAAFWYNLYKSGEGIYNTRHAACPVLVGTKWVSNKWIHERGQEFRRPCGLHPDE